MKTFNQLCVFMLVLIFTTSIQANETKTISAQQLLSIANAPKAAPLIILDVRSEQEFNAGHIANAINIPHNEVEKRLNELSMHQDSLIVVHCRSGRRAQIAEAILTKHGFSQLRHLSGDFNGWQADDLPVVTENTQR
ncbi:rhodanese-like domain-containing protein [Thalassotalea sp. 1_MG-2023]|uniref:rhodanese-like domain-containing protein n=1 Tax=Thalassotalea sp. 1_MG-2023 TaxID=3062680 RepID=UPI0026E2E40B|nr:rhodanese-like domain-containing protein [Thalassotalea sp. 1_MG-2023]MDO6428170.1 rhodanese-like domain-containing protein [Thalassotalea sp. 1_MG-2023]